MRFFNTAGPVNPADHYHIPPLQRLGLDEILSLIGQKKYFVLHAPRQTGKTSCLLALRDYLNQSGQYQALYANIEGGQAARENVLEAMRAVLSEIGSRARIAWLNSPLETEWRARLEASGPFSALNDVLTRWAEQSPVPCILLLDEIDALIGDTLIAVLRQLRAGYDKRPAHFPQSVILCGVRDVRRVAYRIHSSSTKEIIAGGSAFNVKAESLRLGNFSRDEVAALYQQHTDETGQRFEAEALELVWDLTRGQPWLVNALAYEACFKLPAGRNRQQPLTAGVLLEAKEQLILRRETHLDQLVDKLQEERVRRVIEPLLAGEDVGDKIPTDDVQYVRDLGLITADPQIAIANGIYREVIPRELTYTRQITLAHETAWYVRADGRLDTPKLLSAFQQFFRETSEAWLERFDYKEAGPQLLLQAFLQRIVNSGGRIEREYGLGRKRTDLLVLWPYAGPGGGEGVQRVVLELKLLRGSWEQTVAEGLAQTAEYMDKCGADEGHLLIFDRRPGRTWDEKISRRAEAVGRYTIEIWGM